MTGIFNAQILVDKLAKLNSSQQSIETLSHWCIFHRLKAKQVVDTWDRQFHRSPRDQRVSFLYLANDILQNSRRKGSEFVVEFWRVLPHALDDVIQNGDEFGKNAATRLVGIWEERKVFGSRGQLLKEELLGRKKGITNHFGKSTNNRSKLVDDSLEKLVSSFEHVYGDSLDEDTLFSKCKNVLGSIDKMEKEIGVDQNSESASGSKVTQELQGHHSILRECIDQLKEAESSRLTLISHLREALHDQELKLEQVRGKLQVAQARSKSANNMYEKLTGSAGASLSPKQIQKEEAPSTPVMLQSSPESLSTAEEKDKTAAVTYNQNTPLPMNPSRTCNENLKSTAAAMAAKLAASTSSAEMLSSLLSSLASEGIIGKHGNENQSSDNSKRIKLDNAMAYLPEHQQASTQPLQFSHPDSRIASSPVLSPTSLQTSTAMLHPITTMQQQSQMPQSLPLQSPLCPNHLPHTTGLTTSMPYMYVPPVYAPPQSNFTSSSMPSYPVMPGNPNSYQNVQVSEGGSGFQLPQLPSTVPSISHQ